MVITFKATQTTWMNFENIILTERNQTQRPHIVGIHLCKISRRSKSRGRKSGWGGKRGSLY
jgi:hypothetical protein